MCVHHILIHYDTLLGSRRREEQKASEKCEKCVFLFFFLHQRVRRAYVVQGFWKTWFSRFSKLLYDETDSDNSDLVEPQWFPRHDSITTLPFWASRPARNPWVWFCPSARTLVNVHYMSFHPSCPPLDTSPYFCPPETPSPRSPNVSLTSPWLTGFVFWMHIPTYIFSS